MTPEDKKLLQRWSLVLEPVAACRTNGKKEGAYSLRRERKLVRHVGILYTLSASHRSVWMSLLHHAADLSMSSTNTLIGREKLSQEAGVSSTSLTRIFDDLMDLGFVSRHSRGKNRTSNTIIYLIPVPKGEDPPPPVPVSIEDADMAYFGEFKAKYIKPEDALNAMDPAIRAGADGVLDFLMGKLPDHRSVQTKTGRAAVALKILALQPIFGTPHRACQILWYLFGDTNDFGKFQSDYLRASHDLGTCLIQIFPSLWTAYSDRLIADGSDPQ